MDFLDSIRIFKRVHERASFSAAAAELGLGQPAVSKAVAALEQRLGAPLFRRSTRGLSLTESGAKLLAMGGPLLDKAAEVEAAMREERSELAGPLRLTASLAFSRLILEPLLDQFTKRHSKIRAHLQLTDGFVDLVEHGIDLAVRVGQLADSGLMAQRVGSSRAVFYASREFIKKQGLPERIEDLNKFRLIYFTRLSDRPAWPYRDGQGRTRFLSLEDPFLQSDSSDFIREAVIAGRGIALMPSWMMIEEEKRGRVQRFLEPQGPGPVPIYLLNAGRGELTAKQRACGEFLKAEFSAIPTLNE